MPSGITHILLIKNFFDNMPDSKLKSILQTGIYFMQVGAVGPDLPYASIADDDLILTTESELADKFHYEKTNELVLKAFKRIKELQTVKTKKEIRFLYSFFLGFTGHIIADGIMHPFVRDMVGDYKENQTEHRKLEMKLDVLLFHYLTRFSGNPIEFNYSNVHDELGNIYADYYPEKKLVLEVFSDLIKEVYYENYCPEKINGWIKGLHTMFGMAEGDHCWFYKNIPIIEDFLFKDYADLINQKKDILILGKPKDRPYNFLNKPQVHFFDDCLPRFYEVFTPFTKKSYNYVYDNTGDITDSDIPLIDLDTGRALADNNDLDKKPTLWS